MTGDGTRLLHADPSFPLSCRYRNTRMVWLVIETWVPFWLQSLGFSSAYPSSCSNFYFREKNSQKEKIQSSSGSALQINHPLQRARVDWKPGQFSRSLALTSHKTSGFPSNPAPHSEVLLGAPTPQPHRQPISCQGCSEPGAEAAHGASSCNLGKLDARSELSSFQAALGSQQILTVVASSPEAPFPWAAPPWLCPLCPTAAAASVWNGTKSSGRETG